MAPVAVPALIGGLDQWAIHLATAVRPDQPLAIGLTALLDIFLSVDLLKMGVPVLLLLYTWLQPYRRAPHPALLDAEAVSRGVLGITLALLAARLLQKFLPARPRPIEALLASGFPHTDYAFGLLDWSSLPSDHAVLVAAITAAVWAASPRLGMLAALWGLIFVCLPRIYFGLHYVSDIAAGWLIGVAVAALLLRAPLPRRSWTWLGPLSVRRPEIVLLGIFVFGWEMVEVFSSARRLVSDAGRAARALAGWP